MVAQSGINFYERIKQSLTDPGVKRSNFGFFDFSTYSLGSVDKTQFSEPSYPLFEAQTQAGTISRAFTPQGMVPEQVKPQGTLIEELDYTKGQSPLGFYKEEMGPGGVPQMTTLTDAQAREYSGMRQGFTYEDLDARMAELGFSTAYEYSRAQDPVGSSGFTKRTEGGRFASGLIEALAGPAAMVSNAVMGDVYMGLGGKPELEPFGLAGLVSEANYENLYDAARMQARGVPGYAVYKNPDGQLQGVRPASGLTKLFGQEYGAFGASGDINKVRTELAINMGYDPNSFDFSTMTGDSLEGFVTGFGGFNKEGDFVNMRGETSSNLNHGYRGIQYASALADVYGQDYAVKAMQNQASRALAGGGFFATNKADYYNNIASQISSGVREQYTWGTGKDKYTGGYVRSLTGQPVRTGSGGFAYSGQRVSPGESVPGSSYGRDRSSLSQSAQESLARDENSGTYSGVDASGQTVSDVGDMFGD